MKRSYYNKTTEEDFLGKKVKTLSVLKNGNYEVAKGSVLTIERKHGGFSLLCEACEHCKVRIFITKVQPEDVELVD